MRLFVVILIFPLLFPLLSAGQKISMVDSAQKLINQKKFRTAYELLAKADPANNEPEILRKKTSLMTQYYVTSLDHVMFALKDLEAGESVKDYRGQAGDFELYIFDPDSLTRRLLRKGDSSYLLYRNMSDYWFELYLKYGENLKGRESPLDTVKKYSQKAIEFGDRHYKTTYRLAYCYTLEENYQKAIPLFHHSIEQNDSFAPAHYNLGYSYLLTNQYSNALLHANRAFDLYQDSSRKADAARLAGIALMEMEEPKKARIYFKKSLEVAPGDYNSLKNLIQVHFALEQNEKADSLAMEIFSAAPETPRILNQLTELYMAAQRKQQFLAFLNDQLEHYNDEPQVLGNIYFARAKLNVEVDPAAAREDLKKAREHFKKALPRDHYVFDIIQQAMNYVREK
ncbi:MAG: hypothetical protein R6U19_06510 [Bacteroidales bacterium]